MRHFYKNISSNAQIQYAFTSKECQKYVEQKASLRDVPDF